MTARDAVGERLREDPEARLPVQVRDMTSLVVPGGELPTWAGPETLQQIAPPHLFPPRPAPQLCSLGRCWQSPGCRAGWAGAPLAPPHTSPTPKASPAPPLPPRRGGARR